MQLGPHRFLFFRVRSLAHQAGPFGFECVDDRLILLFLLNDRIWMVAIPFVILIKMPGSKAEVYLLFDLVPKSQSRRTPSVPSHPLLQLLISVWLRSLLRPAFDDLSAFQIKNNLLQLLNLVHDVFLEVHFWLGGVCQSGLELRVVLAHLVSLLMTSH